MRAILAILLVLLTSQSTALAHHPPKPCPKIQQHKHDKVMKHAAQNCCREQSGHHSILHHGHHHKKP